MVAGGLDELLVPASLAALLVLVLLAAAWATPHQEAPQARRRAEALLREVLGAEAYAQFVQTGALQIPSPGHPGRVYIIPRGHQPVRVVEPSGQRFRVCIQPVVPLPEADHVLLHKLMLEASEEAYLTRANVLDGPLG